MIITINDDFDLYKITNSGQCFRPIMVSENTFRFIYKEYLLYIRKYSPVSLDAQGSKFSVDCPDTKNDFESEIINSMKECSGIANDCKYEVSCSMDEWERIWHPYFDLDTNYEAIRESIPKDDRYLIEASLRGKGIRILKQDKFEMLISFIISQRKSIPAIRSSVEKICEKFGAPLKVSMSTEGPFAGSPLVSGVPELLHAFPTPEELSKATESELKECGLGYRVPYIMDATRRVLEGRLDLERIDLLSDDELFLALTDVFGVGTKVANCVALFGYHRIGRAPIDTWINKVIDEQYNGINPFPNYPESAGVLQQYMFYSAQHLKSL